MADIKDDGDNKSPGTDQRRARKPYKRPELIYWGTLQELTTKVGNASTVSDGGNLFNQKKTH
jgi:hypothetical protein